MFTTIVRSAPVAQSQAQLSSLFRHDLSLETESRREIVNVPVGGAGRLARVDVSGTASGGTGNAVAVTVAVEEVLEPVSNSRKCQCWFISP